jgi:hypothetical protein
MKNKNQILATTLFMTVFGFSQMTGKTNLDFERMHLSEVQYVHDEFYNDENKNLDLNEITYIEEEEEIDLGFDPKLYLPADFDAFHGMRLNLNDIPYIEQEEEIILDFDVKDYLPKDFSPYSAK